MIIRRRVGTWLAGIALAAVGLAVGVYLLRGILVFPYLERAAAAVFASELNLELAIGDMRGTLWGGLELEGVRIATPPDTETPLAIAIPNLRLHYRLPSLFQGREAFIDELAVAAMGPDVRIHLSRPSGAAEEDGSPFSLAGLAAMLPRITIRDGRLAIAGDGFDTRFEDVSITSLEGASDGAARLALQVGDWQWRLPPLRDGRVRADARVTLAPSGVLSIEELALDGTEVVDAGRVDLTALPAVGFTGRSRSRSGLLEVAGRVEDDMLHLTVDGEAVDLALLDRVLAEPELDVTGTADVQGTIDLQFAHPEKLRGKIDLDLGPGRWRTFAWQSAGFAAVAGDGILTVSRAHLGGAGNSARIDHLALPTGVLFDGSVEALLADLNAGFAVSLTDIPALTASLGAASLPLEGDLPPHHLDLEGTVRGGVLEIGQGILTAGDGTLRVQHLQANLADIREKGTGAAMTLEAALDWPNLNELARLLALPSMSGRLKGEVRLDGSWPSPAGSLALAGEAIAVAGVPLGKVDLALQSDGRWLSAATARLRNGGDRVDLSGRVEMASGRLDAVRLDAQVKDMGPYARALLPEYRPIEGRAALNAEIAGTVKTPELAGDVALDDAVLGSMTIDKARARLRTVENGVQIERLAIHSSQGALTLQGRMAYPNQAAPLVFDLAALSLESRGEALHLQTPVRVRQLGSGRWRIGAAVLAGSAGRVALEGEVGGTVPMDLTVDLDGVAGGAWLSAMEGPIEAFHGLEARLRLTGTPAAPALAVDGTLPHLVLEGWPHPLAGTFDVAAGPDGITIDAWRWTDGAAGRFTAAGHLPVRYEGGWRRLPGPLRLEADLVLEDVNVLSALLPGLPVARGGAEAEVDLGGTLAAPTGRFRADIRDLHLSTDLAGGVRGPFAVHAAGDIDRTGIVVDALAVDSALMTLDGSGRLRQENPLTAWMDTGGSAPAGRLTAAAELRVPDLGWLAAVIPGIQRASGRLEGRLQVDGLLPQPTITADLVLQEAGLRPQGDAPPLRNLEAHLQADAGSVTVQSFRGEIGGSPFELDGALHKEGRGWAADLNLTGDHLLLYRTAGLQVRADTDLHLKGPLQQMTLSGEIGLTGGKLTRYVDFFRALRPQPPSVGAPREVLFSLPDPPLKDLIFDVAINSRDPFRLRNNVINGSLRPDLHLGGTGELPQLTGEIYVDPSRLRLPAGAMEISSGVVQFTAAQANRPVLDLLGQGRLFGYDITALIEGPVSEPRVTLSSSPPLPGDQLMLMLLTGQPPATDRQGTDGGIPMNLAVYVGQDLLTQWLGGEDGGESWASVLDRFEVTTGRQVTRAGDETLEAQFRMGEDVLTDGDTIYLTGEKDRFDFYNAGIKFVFEFK